ncbi:MAG: cupin domain-containing protein [Sedimentisphaerales bacterium]|nr:cupin domain-containing protein [Sedimentisphaerales bacterium]
MPLKVEKAENITAKQVDIEGVRDTSMRLLISRDDGAKNFIMRLFELQPGGHTPLHKHPHEHEVFILEGRGVFICEGEEYDLEPELVIFAPGDNEHQFKNTGDTILSFLCLIPASAG